MKFTNSDLWPIPVQLLALTAIELQQHGVSTKKLLADTDITEEALFEPNTVFPYRTTQKILQRAHDLCPVPHLGFALAARQSPSGMGVLGYAINCCATVEDALNMVVKYFRVSCTLIQPEWRQDNRNFYWVINPPISLGSLLPCVVEEELSTFCGAITTLTGNPAPLLEAHFQYPKPEYVLLYQQQFDCPLFFSSDENKLVMDSHVLQMPILQANSLSVVAAERLCCEFLKANPTTYDLAVHVQELIIDSKNGFLDEASIAEKLSITSRTLRNRLRRLGSSYQEIRNNLQEQIASNDLAKTSLPVSNIAEKIGYSDASSFRRAFKKWTGMTPEKYRKINTVASKISLPS